MEKQQFLFKVLVIGDYAVGKTSLIKRYVDGVFTPNYKLTIGVDFAVKELDWDNEKKVTLQLWDIAGHERFGTMTRVYYKYAVAAMIVFDLSRPTTFDAVLKWHQDLNQKVSLPNEKPLPVLLLANKCDMEGVVVDKEALDQFVQSNGFLGWFATSAQNDTNISEAVHYLVEHIFELSSAEAVTAETTIDLVDPKAKGKEEAKDSSCCN